MLHRCTLILALVAMLLLAGCEKSKITAENFEKVKVGMMLSEVTSYLGSKYEDETPSAGYSISGGGVAGATRAPENVYVFKSKDMKIIVTVKDGKVVQKSKVDL
jgi:major membrane immunogen (membrane-anchored lipoprotein)